MICDRCGREFDPEYWELGFYQLENFNECLCEDCAEKAVDDMEDGLYFEECEECGKRFDYIEADGEFERRKGVSLRSLERRLCLDCAINNYDDEIEDSDDDEDVDENPGVYRSYGEYLESGDPIDPAKDALWLHDEA